MAKPIKGAADGKDDVLRSLAHALTPYLRPLLASNDASEPEYYHQNNSPLGRRRHLALVRRGVLKGRKVGRRVLVSRDDLRAFLEEHPRAAGLSPDAHPLHDWGLTPRRR
jgi:hypothetical protein